MDVDENAIVKCMAITNTGIKFPLIYTNTQTDACTQRREVLPLPNNVYIKTLFFLFL
jgi:hypothetical protein